MDELLEKMAKEKSLPTWRLQHLLALQERIEDFRAVGQVKTAEKLAAKQKSTLDKYLKQATQGVQKKSSQSAKIRLWNEDFLKVELQRVESSLKKNRTLIPRWEHKQFAGQLRQIAEKLTESCSDAHSELSELRERIVDRYFRSSKAMTGHKKGSWNPQKKLNLATPEVVSHYNDSATLNKLLSTLAETDPIWVGDFMAYYSDLMKTADTLTHLTSEKKRK